MTHLFILLPFIVLVIINLLDRRARDAWGFILTFLIFVIQLGLVFWQGLASPNLNWDFILKFNLVIDPLSLMLLFSVGLVGLAALMVGHFTIATSHERFNFKNLLLVSLVGINVLAMVRDVFSLYVFIEITAIATFILITLYKDKPALEGALKYLILSVVASTLMLTSIAVFLMLAGDLSFVSLAAAPHNHLWQIALLLFISGLCIKGGLVPFHGWLPDAYTAAPACVSVFLAGIVTKASGIFVLIRLVTALGGLTPAVQSILLLFGTLSIVIGALAARRRKI